MRELTDMERLELKAAMSASQRELRECLDRAEEYAQELSGDEASSAFELASFLRIRLGDGKQGWQSLMEKFRGMSGAELNARLSVATAYLATACKGGLDPSDALADMEYWFDSADPVVLGEFLLDYMNIADVDVLPEGTATVARRFLEAINVDPSEDLLDEQFANEGKLYLEEKSRFNRTLMYEKELRVEDFKSPYWRPEVSSFLGSSQPAEPPSGANESEGVSE